MALCAAEIVLEVVATIVCACAVRLRGWRARREVYLGIS